MTADDENMQASGRVVARKDDDETQESWIPLADVKDGQRENWMVDRAKHALGTAKLASIYLEQEKGRIRRLRKIKSVLASGKLTGSPTHTKENQGRRRRRPHPDQVHHPSRIDNGHQGHVLDASNQIPDGRLPTLPSRYPSSVSGGKCRETWFGEAGPEDAFKRSTKRSTSPYLAQVQPVRDRYSTGGKFTRNFSSKQVPMNLVDENEPSRRPPAEMRTEGQWHNIKPDFFGGSKHPSEHEHMTGAGAVALQGQGSMFRSGPSAIDLFDSGDVVAAPASQTKRSTESPNSTGAGEGIPRDAPAVNSAEDDTTAKILLPATRRPLVPTVAPVMRGRNRLVRDPKPLENIARNGKRRRPRQVTELTKAKSPSADGALGPKGRASKSPISIGRNQGRAEGSSSDERRDGDCATSRIPRGNHRETRQATNLRAVTPTEENIRCGNTGRVRRRWNMDRATRPSGEGTMKGRGHQDQTITLARFASAQARLGKTKDLHELKSEHVEALSILKGITAPPTGTHEKICEAQATRQTCSREKQLELRERSRQASSRHSRTSTVKATRNNGGLEPDEASIVALTSDLPRIGSPEEAALRTLYRKWWMDIVNGTSPPLTTPDAPRQPGRGAPDVEHRVKRLPEDGNRQEISALPVSPSGARSKNTPLAAAEGVKLDEVRDGGGTEVRKDVSTGDNARPSTGGTSSLTESPGRPIEGIRGRVTSCISGERTVSEDAVGNAIETGTEGGSIGDEEGVVDRNEASPTLGDTVVDGSTSASVVANGKKTVTEDVSFDRGTNTAQSPASDATREMTAEDASTPFQRGTSSDDDSQRARRVLTEDERDESGGVKASDPTQVDNGVEPVLDEEALTLGGEEGHQGRIYLPDGRFVSTGHVGEAYSAENKREQDSPGSGADGSSVYDDDFEE